MVKKDEYPVVSEQLEMGEAKPERAVEAPQASEADGTGEFKLSSVVLGRLATSISEARRYIELATKAERALISGKGSVYWCAEMAEAKRASMPLTRALADVRKGARDA